MPAYEDSDGEDEANTEEDEILVQDYGLHTHEGETPLCKEDEKKDEEDDETLTDGKEETIRKELVELKGVRGPRKTRIVIKDFAYTTYRAVLYYVSHFLEELFSNNNFFPAIH